MTKKEITDLVSDLKRAARLLEEGDRQPDGGVGPFTAIWLFRTAAEAIDQLRGVKKNGRPFTAR